MAAMAAMAAGVPGWPSPELLALGLVAVILGAAVGSFLNVVVYRLPAGLSLVHPPSRCPHCLHRLAPYDNVPVLGWLWLRGRCRYCGAPIAARYPLVEAFTGLLFGAIALRFGYQGQVVSAWVLASWLVALALIDWDTMTLPNRLTQPGLLLGLGFSAAGWGLGSAVQTADLGAVGPSAIAAGLLDALLAMALGLWLFQAIATVGRLLWRRTAMGAGDVKLAAMLGAWLGWKLLLLASFLACLIGAVGGLGAIALGWLPRDRALPFGPCLAIGSLLALLCGPELIATYVQFWTR
jgi:leader peptidase (prepilin peptidase)/N-methyltransferase